MGGTLAPYRTVQLRNEAIPANLRNAGVMADTKVTKTVGEHWVCATLARHGWAPALTRDGIAWTDILAVGTRLARRPMVEIQVKTASDTGSRRS